MAIKQVFSVFLIIFFLKANSQVPPELVKATNEKYGKFYNSSLTVMNPNNKWGIITDYNLYGIQRAKLLSVESGTTEEIPFSSRYFFFGNDIVIAQGMDQTLIKNLTSQVKKVISGNFQYLPFPEIGKMVFYERRTKELLVFDNSFKEISSFNSVKMVSLNDNFPFLDLCGDNKVYRIDLRSMQKTEWEGHNDIMWIGGARSEIVTVESFKGKYQLSRYGKNTLPKVEKLDIPKDFYLDSISTSLFELRNNRFMVLPLKKLIPKNNERGDIFYTNQNSNYKLPLAQMAIYDLYKGAWKRLPDKSDEFATQQFIDKKGTILSYDASKDTVDSLIVARYEQSIENDFGGTKQKIDNVHVRKENFHYDPSSQRMIYFKDHRWRIENTANNIVREIPFEQPEHFISEIYSGLSDRPSGWIYPTNLPSQYIITDQYDLFLVDLIKVTVKRLTSGRDKELMFSIPEQAILKNRPDSYWDVGINQQLDLSNKILLKALNRRDYSSKLCEFDFRTMDLKELVAMDDVVQNIYRSGNDIVYTMESYQTPLSVNVIKNGTSNKVYQNKGVDEGELIKLKKEILRYQVNGKTYNAALLYPANFSPNTKYPLIFNVYERKSKDILYYQIPHLFESEGFNIMHYVHNGYFILLPDFDYEPENVGRSISTSVDSIVDKLKDNRNVDLDKMAVFGHSFGGYEATFLMTQNKWFITGIAGAGFVDLPRQATSYHKFGYLNYFPDYARVESQQNRMVKNLFDNYQGYLENSPIYHLKKLSKPIFLWAGKDDDNILVDQSRSFFIGMKRLGKKGTLLEYPKEKHNLRIKENQLDLNVKSWQWMDYFLKEQAPADWIKPLVDKGY